MKRISMAVMVVLAATVVPVVHADDCSNSTLKGTYTFQTSGWYLKFPKSDKSVPSANVGIATFDGGGHFTDLYTQSIDGQIFSNLKDEGTYTVNPDCTGSLKSPSGAYQFDFALEESGVRGVMIETDAGTTNTGILKRQ